MNFEWDEAKNLANLEKHGIDFVDVVDMFNYPMLTLEDCSVDYGEVRWIGIGYLRQLVSVVIYTERVGNSIRIISARKATKNEVRHYEQTIQY